MQNCSKAMLKQKIPFRSKYGLCNLDVSRAIYQFSVPVCPSDISFSQVIIKFLIYGKYMFAICRKMSVGENIENIDEQS